jgi:hypothetical protein
LVLVRAKIVIDEDAVTAFPRNALERKRDQIAKATDRHSVLAREEAVIGVESDVRATLHCLGEEERP